MRILVGDDEPLARQRLMRLLQGIPSCSQVAEAASGREVLQKTRQFKPDLVLLDIRMPDIDGLAAAKSLQACDPAPKVIFCTAFDEHALEAFKVHALDYLLKPISREALGRALDRVEQLSAPVATTELSAAVGGVRRHIGARTHRGVELIAVADIRYFLADQKYVSVRYAGGEVLIDDPLKMLEDEFSDAFVRIHRNALVALRYLEGLEQVSSGQYRVRLAGIDEKLVVSRRHVAGLRKLMKRL